MNLFQKIHSGVTLLLLFGLVFVCIQTAHILWPVDSRNGDSRNVYSSELVDSVLVTDQTDWSFLDSLGVRGDSIQMPKRGLRIVYINADSLLENYLYYQDLRDKMIRKAQASEKELESEASKLETEIEQLQKRAADMSEIQRSAAEEGLMRKQQNVINLRDNLTAELEREEEQLDRLFRAKVQGYFRELARREQYDYILSYHSGSNLLLGSDGLNITRRALMDLNSAYRASQKASH
ncbi:MAG: OmpH family outer membrane protein [Sphingomonadales bacterium]|nr:OmpH family outer membrane protein [Sphingomonadales bacterium]